MAAIPEIPNMRVRQPEAEVPPKVAGSGRNPPPAATRTTAAQKRDEVLTEDLVQLYTLGGVMVSLIRPDIGSSMVEHGEQAAISWVELAQKNTRVRKALEDLTAASVWGAVIAVHVKMFAPAIAVLPKVTETPRTDTDGVPIPDLFDPGAMGLAMQMMNGMRGGGDPIADTVRVP
jgi:hypothetical protein